MVDLFEVNRLVMFYRMSYPALNIRVTYDMRDFILIIIVSNNDNMETICTNANETTQAKGYINDFIIDFLAKYGYREEV